MSRRHTSQSKQSQFATAHHCTVWRRLIGSPKLQIIFRKRATKYRALLRKMTYKDKGSYESSPPCMCYESGHTIEWVTLHVWMSHVTLMNESCHTYEWVMSHVCLSHVTCMTNDQVNTLQRINACTISQVTHEWVKSHIWMGYFKCMKESCHT